MLTTINSFAKSTAEFLKSSHLLIRALSVAAILLFADRGFAQVTGGQSNALRPKLVVFLIADQFSSHNLSFCLHKSQANGFKRLIAYGANFTACRYKAATNQTAGNLAVIACGAYPWATGIIGDKWYDRHKRKVVEANFSDGGLLSANDNVNSGGAHALIGTTIGDELKIASRLMSRVVTIAGCDHDAILLAGKLSEKAYWWDSHSADFVMPTHSVKDLPGWTKKFNEQNYSGRYAGETWQPLTSDNTDLNADTIYGGFGLAGDKSFAHTMHFSSVVSAENLRSQFMATPWANRMMFDFGCEAINGESLGQHQTPDMLGINFCSFENVANTYGANGEESLDLALRFDQDLADFLEFLDKKIGLNNCLVVFTACHGAGASNQFLRGQGVEAGTIEAKNFREQLNSALSSKLGTAEWIECFEPPNLYLNLNSIDHSRFNQPDIEKLAAKLGRSISGTAEIYGAFQLFMNQMPNGPLVESVRKSYFWGRSGELYVVPKPGFVFVSETDGTPSGSPYNYDAQVPLIIGGNSIRPGTYTFQMAPDDIAPTVAEILNISPPALAEGKVLSEVLKVSEKVAQRR